MGFAETFKERRKKLGLTQQELAEKLDIDRSAVAHYEGGTSLPNAKKLKIIGKVLNVPID